MSFFFSFLFTGLSAFAGTPLSSYLVSFKSPQQMDQLAEKFEVVRRTKDGFEILVPQNRSKEFQTLAPEARLLSADASAQARAVFTQSQLERTEGGYHSLSEVIAILQSLAQEHSDLVQLETYGTSHDGHPLLALRVSRHLNQKLPRVLLTAATHGDEIITTEVLLSLMQELVTKSASPRFARILEQSEVVFIPVVNPDGFSNQERYEQDQDPNRSYPYPDFPLARPTPSIGAELKLIEKYPIVGSIDFHAYSGLVMYPWGYTRTPLEPEAYSKFESITGKMAETNFYGHGQISNLLYIAKGSSVDYYFWKYHTLALGIEMGDSKSPDPAAIPDYIHDQQESTWMFLESFLPASN